ncbi:MAG: RNA polymerase sigma factor [Myxococcota bacterium]
MHTTPTTTTAGSDGLHAAPDDAVIERVRGGDIDVFEVLMRRYNQRIFRVVRSILGSDAEAEDAAQEAWLAAFRKLGTFEGRSAFPTWLTRIAIRRALARRGRGRREVFSPDEVSGTPATEEASPDRATQRREAARLLERAIDALPPNYRVVVMLRDVEQVPTAEAAEALGLSEQNLRVRLHRARAALRGRLVEELGDGASEVFRFAGARCDRMVANVLARIRQA